VLLRCTKQGYGRPAPTFVHQCQHQAADLVFCNVVLGVGQCCGVGVLNLAQVKGHVKHTGPQLGCGVWEGRATGCGGMAGVLMWQPMLSDMQASKTVDMLFG
jgi:hypothetical protein